MSYDIYANDVTGKSEDSAVAMIQAAVTAGHISSFPTTSIHPFIQPEERALPCVVCESDDGTAEEVFDGNWDIALKIHILASADSTTREQFRLMCGEVWSRFFMDPRDVETALSNSTIKFTAHAVYPRRQNKVLVVTENNTRQWQGTLTLSVKCCGSVVA